MAPLAPGIGALAILAGAALALAGDAATSQAAPDDTRIVIRGSSGETLASVPLAGSTFAVAYRNSLYRTLAEERYRVLPDGRYRLEEIAADQMAVIEEYYSVPGPPRPAPDGDRRKWVAPPDPTRPVVLDELSIAATDLGERTLHVPGEPPLALWTLVEDERPFVVLNIEEYP